MKKLPPFTVISLALSSVSCGLTFYHYNALSAGFDLRIAASVVGLVAFFVVTKEFLKFTGPLQFTALFASILSVGVSVDPVFSGIPFITLSLLLIFVASHKDMLFRSVFSETTGSWLSIVLTVLGVFSYVYGNMSSSQGWQAWVFPAPIMIFCVFMMVRGMVFGKMSIKIASDKKMIHEAGKEAPDFCLRDHEGAEVKLSDFKGKRDVLLIFVRSHWCPSCHIMLRAYNRNSDKFKEKNILLFAIGPDASEVNKQMALDLGIDFKVLSDEGLKTSMAYRVHLPAEAAGKDFAGGFSLPASFLIDKRGVIRYTSRPDRIGEFLDPMTIFPVLESLN